MENEKEKIDLIIDEGFDEEEFNIFKEKEKFGEIVTKDFLQDLAETRINGCKPRNNVLPKTRENKETPFKELSGVEIIEPDPNFIPKEDIFKNVYGYDSIKKELKLIKSWFENKNILSNDKVTLPKGLLFYGEPGCGKTLFMREFVKALNAFTYVLDGDKISSQSTIKATFSKAREKEFAVIVVDEFDLLIDRNSQIVRLFQEALDGMDKRGHILFLASTNHISYIPDALLRPGRFDRKIKVSFPEKESLIKLLNEYLKKLEISTEKLDFEHIAKVLKATNGASIQAICNDVYLRCGKHPNTSDIERSFERIINDDYSEEDYLKFKNKRTAVHEAGHILMTMRFQDDFGFYKAKFVDNGAVTETIRKGEGITLKSREEEIMIGMAGYLSEEIIFHKHDFGCSSDMEHVYDLITRYVERSFVDGITTFIPSYSSKNYRYETYKKRNKNEKIMFKYLKKFEKDAKKFLKRNKKELIKLAEELFQKGSIKHSEIEGYKFSA